MTDNVMHLSTMWVLDCHELQKATGIDWRCTEFGREARNNSYNYLACDDDMIKALQENIKELESSSFYNYECLKIYKNTLAVINYIREHLRITDGILINVYW